MSRVDIVLPELSLHDATSAHTRALRDLLLESENEVSLVVERIRQPAAMTQAGASKRAGEVVLLSEWRADADLTILQHSIGSIAAEEVIRRQTSVVVNYHNITPSDFMEIWEPQQINGLRWGRDQLARLARIARFGIADSEFNARELRAVGLRCVEVAPVLVDDAVLPSGGGVVSDVGAVGSGVVGGSGLGSKATVLFVGRLAPNKCQQDLVSALAVLRRWVPGVELVLVGASSSDAYEVALKEFAAELGVGDAVKVLGSVSVSELVGWYRQADVFLCLSEHEGFCVPLVEAMAWGVPVVAAAAAAVPETLGGAGLLLADKSPVVVATAVQRVLVDAGLRERLVSRGLVRAAELSPVSAKNRMRQILEPLLDASQSVP